MFAVCLSASAKGKRNVERGMTKQEVIAILGEPKLTSFDMYGDKWEYAKYNNLFGDSKYITVFFDRNGKVVQYDTRIIEPNSQTSNVQQPQHPTPPIYDGRCDPDGRMDYGYCLNDASFTKLYNKVKAAGGRLATIIASTAHVSKYAELGEGTVIMHQAFVNAGAKIGDNCIINTFVNIEHDAEVGNQCHISTGTMVNGECKIGENCFIGSQSVCANCIEIASDIIVGAGSVVRKSIRVKGIYAGNPAILKIKAK